MYLRHVKLTNIRSFHGGRAVDLDLTRPDGTYADWTVLAGHNGSGKTTLLRAIALAVSGPDVAHSLVPGFEHWISHGASHATAEVLLDGPSPSSGLTWTAPVDMPEGTPPTISRLRAARQPAPNNGTPRWLCAGYGPFRRLVGGSSETQRLMTTTGPVSSLTSLFHDDASLAEGVSWLITQHLRAFENRAGAQELKDAALAILGDELLPDGFQIDGVDSEGLWVVVHDGRRFPLREMSDGYRTVAALVVDLLKQLYNTYGELDLDTSSEHPSVSYNGIVLIDEVDAHLHVTWQKRIGGWLKAHFPGIQFIVTTHSPYICQAADPGGLIRLPSPDEDRPAEIVSEDLYQRIVYGSGDDAVLSDLFGLDSPYSEQAEEARDELVALEADVLRGTASESERSRYRELSRRLTSSPAARVDEIEALLRGRNSADS